MDYDIPKHWKIIYPNENISGQYKLKKPGEPVFYRKDNKAFIYEFDDVDAKDKYNIGIVNSSIDADINGEYLFSDLNEAIKHADTLILMDFFNKNNPVAIKIAKILLDKESLVDSFYNHGISHDIGDDGNICLLAGHIETLAESE